MKKLLLPVLVFAAIGLAIFKYGARRLFTPGAVQKVRDFNIEKFKKDADEAEERFRKELNTADRVGRAYEKLGKKYIDNKNWTPGIKSLEKAVEYGSSGARVHYYLGMAYANRGRELSSEPDISKAENHYKRAIEINNKLVDAAYGLGILHFYLKKDQKKGLSVIKAIVETDKKYIPARFALGRFYYEMRETQKSLATYEDLYSDLEKMRKSPQVNEYRKNCKENISRLMMELSRGK